MLYKLNKIILLKKNVLVNIVLINDNSINFFSNTFNFILNNYWNIILFIYKLYLFEI